MANGLSKLDRAIARTLQAHAQGSDRYLDMQAAVYLPAGERPVFRVGGRWDTIERCYDGAAATECEIRLTEAQAVAWPLIQRWLTRYVGATRAVAQGAAPTMDDALVAEWGDRSPLLTLQLFGGRQGGKTHLAAVLVSLVCVALPGATAAIVSSIAKKTTEIVEILERFCLPASWRQTVTSEIRLANGSRLVLYTGAVSDLKGLGPIEVGLLNESQVQKKSNWSDVQGATIARAGMVVLAQNPPRSRIGEWTQELYDDVKAGRLPSASCCWIKPRLNKFASNLSIAHLASTMSEKERRRDIDGDMGVATGDTVLDRWTSSRHAIGWIPTTWDDVTEEITRAVFGRPFDKVGGLDWDKGAGPSFALGRIFRPHNAPSWAWTLVIEHGQTFTSMAEERFPAHLRSLQDVYGRTLAHPSTTIWVGDASGRYQSSERKFDENDSPSWQRMQVLWPEIVPPDPVQLRNPRRRERFDLINRYVLADQPATGQPRVVMVAATAGHVIDASQKLPQYGLEASRRSQYAHIVDAWTYLSWRLFSQEYQAFIDGVPEIVARNKSASLSG